MADIPARLESALAGRYVIERELGRGGMSTVFLARDVRHDREVALKVLREPIAQAVGAQRFLQEIRVISRLQHPHILPLFDSGEADGQLFYVMPQVAGESLRNRLSREKQLPVEDALRITREVADALNYAHARGVVHRDIKPENILLSPTHAMVADFGIARAVDIAGAERITDKGLAVGTPAYMSPEQASGEADIDGRSDIYSLGCVLYEMLTGQTPFTGPTSQAVIARRFVLPPPNPTLDRPAVPESAARSVVKALSLIPADRFQTGAEFIAALSGGGGGGGEGKGDEKPSLPPSAISPRKGRTAIITSGVTAFMLLAGYGVISRYQAVNAPGFATAPVALNSIVVLPFVNLSGDLENEYFSDGMTEELIAALTKVDGLRVVSRTSSFALKGQRADVKKLGGQLGVGAVLDGSVRKDRERLRITVQLTKVADGFQLWSESYNRQIKDVFTVQEEISRAIASALKIQLGSQQPGMPVTTQTENIEAYDLYLKGRYFWNKRTEAGMNSAIQYFEAAIKVDSKYARAYAGLADAYAVSGFYDYRAPRNAFPRAQEAAERALALDESLVEPHATLAYVTFYYAWDWAEAERKFREAIERGPRYATAHQFFGNLLVAMGRFDEAASELYKARQLEPASLIINAAEAWVAYHARNYDDAIAHARRAIVFDSTFALAHLWMGMVQEQRHDSAAASASLQRALTLSRAPSMLGALGHFHAAHGNREAATRLRSELQTARSHVSGYEIAIIETGLGNRDVAFDWLERAYAQREHSMVFIGVDPRLDPLRSDRRFASLLREMRLPP
ncbi:MAG: protein kinase [Gemmatimonadaceae bacterium]